MVWKAHVLAFSRSLTSSSNGDRPIRPREDRICGRIHPAATAAGILQPISKTDQHALIEQYANMMKINGKPKTTITPRIRILKQVNKLCDITNPYEVKEKLSRLKWKNLVYMKKEKSISLNFDCPKGEAIFHTSFCTAFKVNPSELEKLPDDVIDLISSLHLLDDDRLIALVGELIVENAFEKYLSASMLGYRKELSNKKDFTFSWKIAVAKSLKLSPPKIFSCVDVIRRIRNEFAHDLNKKDFINIKTELIKDLENALLNINYYITEKRTLREKFFMLTLATTAGLIIFTKDANLLSSFLRSESFQKSLIDYSKTIRNQ